MIILCILKMQRTKPQAAHAQGLFPLIFLLSPSRDRLAKELVRELAGECRQA
jgi:hypothetical protein